MAWTASDFERVDPKLFRGFLAVVKTGSFSEAANEAHLTQGAVSQQVARLEERLSVQLFHRGGQRMQLTDAGKMLAEFAEQWLMTTSSLAEKINQETQSMTGLVSYAMPESCIHSPHFGMLLAKRVQFPHVKLKIGLKPSADVYTDLIRGEIDFGFLTESFQSNQIEQYPFCKEEYVWVSSSQREHKIQNLGDLLEVPFISFPGVESLISRWASSCFPSERNIPTVAEMNVCGEFNDIRGAIAMVQGGLGVSIFPTHVIGASFDNTTVKTIFTHSRPALQQIYIARLKQRYMPARVRRVIGWFLEMHADLQPVPQAFLP